LRLYFQTGSVVGRSYTQDGEFNNARVPITQLTSNSGASKMQMLIANYNHYLGLTMFSASFHCRIILVPITITPSYHTSILLVTFSNFPSSIIS